MLNNLFLEARAEILKKNFVGFLVETTTPKRHFEINWPLSCQVMADMEKFYDDLIIIILKRWIVKL